MDTLAAITNVDFGLQIGLSGSQVSRLRAGQRLPSIDTMIAIKDALDWSLDEQGKSRLADSYAEDLEQKLKEKFGATPDNG